jgi:hypothetical protein
MLQWNDLHPYNAVHVIRIPQPLDPERLRAVIDRGLETRGLTSLSLDRDQGTYCYHGGPSRCPLEHLAVGGVSWSALEAEIERQLNTGFEVGERFDPFRFFTAAAADSFALGMAYFHAVADAESVVRLLQELADSYPVRAGSERPLRLDLYPRSADSLAFHPRVLVNRLLALPGVIRDLRSSCRTRARDPLDLSNRLHGFVLEPARLRSLVATAKAWQVTLHDLFLALLLRGLAALAPDRPAQARRRRLSVGTIVNLRRDCGVEGRTAFGLFLGSFVVTHAAPPGIELGELARDIRHRTRRIKDRRLYLGTPLELAFGRFMLSLFSPERRRKFYQKHYPLWGGITNMNLNTLRGPGDGKGPVDYLRAVSTGPATPLVLSVTTVGDHANVGLTYRPAVFSSADIERLATRFLAPVNGGRVAT